jgi:hypothetical protein
MENKQFSAAIAAIREVGVLSGQRLSVARLGEFAALSDDELILVRVTKPAANEINTSTTIDRTVTTLMLATCPNCSR